MRVSRTVFERGRPDGRGGCVKPPRLREEDTVGIISPSWGGGAAYPHRVERGVECLESCGFRLRIALHAL